MPSFTARGLVTIQAIIGPNELHRDYCRRNMDRCADDVTTSALIDTGAEVSIVDPSILRALHLSPYDERLLVGINGDAELHPVYSVWLKVCTKDGSVVIDQPMQEVCGAPIPSEDYKVVLGMDVLRSVTLKLNHAKKWVQLCPTTDEEGEVQDRSPA